MNTLEQLHELHERLVRAQRAESAAMRKLTEFAASGTRARDGFGLLLDAVQAARQRTVEIYDEWDRHARALQSGSSEPTATNGASSPAG